MVSDVWDWTWIFMDFLHVFLQIFWNKPFFSSKKTTFSRNGDKKLVGGCGMIDSKFWRNVKPQSWRNFEQYNMYDQWKENGLLCNYGNQIP